MGGISGGFLRVLSLILVFILGFLTCAGALVLGGVYVYRNVSYETLQGWGVPLPSTDELLDSHADVRLTALSLEAMVREFGALSELGEELTLQVLVDRYGVKLPSQIETLLPDALMKVSLTSLFSAEGLDYLLTNTTVEYLFQFLPEGTLSAPAKAELKDIKLSELMGSELGAAFADMQLGYFLDVRYDEQDDGSYCLVYEDSSAPTIYELLAPLSIGELIDAMENDGDILKVVKENDDISNCSLSQLLGDSFEGPMASFVEGKTVGDLIVYDSDEGKYALKVEQLTAGVLLGDVMGYEPVKDDPVDPELVTGWLQGGEKVNALESAIADVALDELMSDDFEFTDVVEDLYLGDVMGYRYEESEGTYVWCEKERDENGALVPLTGIDKAMAGVLLGDVLNGDGDVITNAFADLYLGEVMGYEREESEGTDGVVYTWYETKMSAGGTSERVALDGMDEAIANILLDDLLNNENYEFSDAFDDLYLGEVIGYEYEESDGTYVWYEKERDENGELVPLTGIDKAMAGVLLGDVLNGDGDVITNAFADLYLGEIMGYEYEESEGTYVWYEKERDENGDLVPLKGIDKAVANILLDDLLNNEDYEISDAFDDLYLGEVIGYEQGELIKAATEDAPAEYAWLEDGQSVNGIQKKFSNYLLSDIMDGTADISADDMYLYEVLDLHKVEYPAYDAEDKTKLLTTYTVWYEDDGTRAANVFSALADVTVAELEDALPNVLIGEMIGMVAVSDRWYDVSEVIEEAYVVLTPADGIMTSFADLTIDDMSDDEKVRTAVNDLSVSEVLGYTQDEDGKYYDGDEEVTGIMAVLAGEPVGNLSSAVDNVYIGEVVGWTPTWVDDDDHALGVQKWTDKDGKEPTGVMSYFANLTVKQMSDEDEVYGVVQEIALYDALGYTKDEDGKYYDGDEEVTGIMAVLAEEKVGNLSSAVDNVYIGEVVGWTPTWVDENDHALGVQKWTDKDGEEPTGIMLAFADLTVKDLSDEDEVHKAVEGLTLAEAMNYVKGENGKYYDVDVTKEPYQYRDREYYVANDKKVEPIHGVLATLADAKIGEMEEEVQGTYVGEVMGWEPVYADPDDPKKITGWQNENGEPERGVAVSLAGLTLSELSDDDKVATVTKGIQLSTVLDFTEGEDGRFYEEHVTEAPYKYDEEDGVYYVNYGEEKNVVEPATGIVVAFASLTVGDMHDHEKVQEAVGRITVAEVMDYEVRTVDGKDVYYDGTQRVDGIMAALAGTKIEDLDDRINDLQLSDVFSAEELKKGFLSLIDPDTYLYDVGTDDEPSRITLTQAVSDAIKESCIGELQGAGLISLDEDTTDLLNKKDEFFELKPGNKTDGYYWCAKYDENGNIKDYVGPYDYYWQTLPVDKLLNHILSTNPPAENQIIQSVDKPSISNPNP